MSFVCVHVSYQLPGCFADAQLSQCNHFNVAAFVKSRVQPEDFVMVKMDIEGMEYAVLDQMEAFGIQNLIDEFFC